MYNLAIVEDEDSYAQQLVSFVNQYQAESGNYSCGASPDTFTA